MSYRRTGRYGYGSGRRGAGRLRKTGPMQHAVTGSVGKNEYHGDHRDQYVLSLGALSLNPYALPAGLHYRDANGQNQARVASNVWYHVSAALLRKVLKMVVKRDVQYPMEKLMYDLPAAGLNNAAANTAGGYPISMENYGTHGLTSINACRLRLYWHNVDGRVDDTPANRFSDIPFMWESDPNHVTGANATQVPPGIGDKKSFGQVAIELSRLLSSQANPPSSLLGRYPYAVELFGIDATSATTSTVVNGFVERALCSPIIIKDWIYTVNCSGSMRIQNQTANDDGTSATDVMNNNPLLCVRQVFSGLPVVKSLIGSNPQAETTKWDQTGIYDHRSPEVFQEDTNQDCLLKHINKLRKLPPRSIWQNCVGEERFMLQPGQIYSMPLRTSFRGTIRTLMHRLSDYLKADPGERERRTYPLGYAQILFATQYMAADHVAPTVETAAVDPEAEFVPVLINVQYQAEFKCGASVRPRYRSTMMVLDAAGIFQVGAAFAPTTGAAITYTGGAGTFTTAAAAATNQDRTEGLNAMDTDAAGNPV